MTRHTPCCRKCGYLLHGLPDNICPECGTGFDPSNPRTYDTLDSRGRRRRVIRRALALLLLAGVIYGVAPRHIIHGKLTLTCKDCGKVRTTKRWEPLAPSWIPVRYPGAHWTVEDRGEPGPDARQSPSGCRYVIAVDTELHGRPPAGSIAFSSAEVAAVNGVSVSPDNASEILYVLMSPSLRHVRVDPPRAPNEPPGAFFIAPSAAPVPPPPPRSRTPASAALRPPASTP